MDDADNRRWKFFIVLILPNNVVIIAEDHSAVFDSPYMIREKCALC